MVSGGETRIGVYGLAIDDGRVLLARISSGEVGAGDWTLPGGGLDWGEHPSDGLRREFFEETGIEPVIHNPIGIFSFVVPAATRPTSDVDLFGLQIIYRTEARGDPQAEVDGSTDLAHWWALREIETVPLARLAREALELAGISLRSTPLSPTD